MTTQKKKGPGFAKGLLAGAIFGIAAGIFMSSKEGKKMAKQLQMKASEIEKRLIAELRKKADTSQQSYADAIDGVLDYYLKTKKIAKTEIPELRKYLVSKWQVIKSEIETIHAKVKKATKKAK